MEVSWQDKGDALQPVRHSYSLWLPGLFDGSKLVWEVAVQVKIVAVVPSFVSLYITCEETSTTVESSTYICNHSLLLLTDTASSAWLSLHILFTIS